MLFNLLHIHRFQMKVRNGSEEGETVNVTVYDYFREKKI